MNNADLYREALGMPPSETVPIMLKASGGVAVGSGSFIYQDPAWLELGIMRDSAMDARNDYKIFAETFETPKP
jgi:hypothetical protein